MKKTKKNTNRYPRGLNAAKVRRIIEYYENQSDEEAAAEDEAAFSGRSGAVMSVPRELVPTVRRLISSYENRKSAAQRQ